MKGLRVATSAVLPFDWIVMATVGYGGRGSGKTTFAAVVAEEVDAAGQRFCAIDLKGDMWGLKASADSKSEGIPVVIFGGDHADLPLEDGAGKFLGELVAGLSQSCVLDLEHMSKGRQLRFLGEFFAALYHHNRDPLLVICDEAQRYAPQNARMASPDATVCLGAVEDLVKLGRKHGLGVLLLTQRGSGLGVLLLTQRGSGLNKEVSELCDMLVAFRTPGKLDQERIRDWLDGAGYLEEWPEIRGRLARYKNGQCVIASAHPSLDLFDQVQIRPRRTFDSSATPKVGERRVEPKRLARPELETIRARMADAIERQKAEDPKALQAELARLRAELAKRANGHAPAVRVERVEVPVITRAELERAERLVDKLAAHRERIADKLQASNKEVAKLCGYVEGLYQRAANAVGVASEERKNTSDALYGTLKNAIEMPSPMMDFVRRGVASMPEISQVTPAPPDVAGLSLGERIVLEALIGYPDGLDDSELSILTGYKATSRKEYLRRLISRGYAEKRDGRSRVTVEGRHAMPGAKPLPKGAELVSYWYDRLRGGERKIFKSAVEAYPDVLSNESIEQQTGYKPSARKEYTRRLVGYRVVVRAAGGIQASTTLFQ